MQAIHENSPYGMFVDTTIGFAGTVASSAHSSTDRANSLTLRIFLAAMTIFGSFLLGAKVFLL